MESTRSSNRFSHKRGSGEELRGGLDNLHIRWLGKVAYQEAWELQKGLFHSRSTNGQLSTNGQPLSSDQPSSSKQPLSNKQSGQPRIPPKNYLLLLEHPPVYTFGIRGEPTHLLSDPKKLGAETFRVDRGGDITFHGMGQLVGYPILTLPSKKGGLVDTAGYVYELESLIMEVLQNLGIDSCRRDKFPGVWVDGGDRKIASIGVKLNRGRTMHGFGLNVATDLSWFDHIVPCGISGIKMTSIEKELAALNTSKGNALKDVFQNKTLAVQAVGELIAKAAVKRWGKATGFNSTEVWAKKASTASFVDRVAAVDSFNLVDNSGSVEDASTKAYEKPYENGTATNSMTNSTTNSKAASPKAPNLKVDSPKVDSPKVESQKITGLKITERKPEWLRAPVIYSDNHLRLKKTLKDLPTVCESAGCPNLFECWGEGTATFMINGDRCTRNCGFCLVDTQKPLALDETEPERLAKAVEAMGLNYVVITAVARDDLADGGVGGFVNTIRAVRKHTDITVELLIPDFRGDMDLLDTIFAERPEVLNHNLETVLRLQKLVRPQASYARSLAVLARAKSAGLVTKSSLMVGLGETPDEVKEALIDLGEVGVDIVTIGQYLRPSQKHLPVARWWQPDEFETLAGLSEAFGIGHIEAGPLVRSSYRAGKVQTAFNNMAANSNMTAKNIAVNSMTTSNVATMHKS